MTDLRWLAVAALTTVALGAGVAALVDQHKRETQKQFLEERRLECPPLDVQPGLILTDPLGGHVELISYDQAIGFVSTGVSRADPCSKAARVRYAGGEIHEVGYHTLARWMSENVNTAMEGQANE